MSAKAQAVTRVGLCAVAGYVLAQAALWPAWAEGTPVGLTALTLVALTSTTLVAVVGGFAAGIVFWYTLLGWATGSTVVGDLTLAAATVAMLESAYCALWSYAVVRSRRLPIAVAALASALLCALEEQTRTIGTWAMPYGEIGASQSTTLAASVLPLVGTTGLSVLLVALAYAFARTLLDASRRSSPRHAGLALVLGCLLVAAALPAPAARRPAAPAASVVVVPTAPVAFHTVLNTLERTRWEKGWRPQAVILPEGAIDLTAPEADPAALDRWVRRTGVPLLSGAVFWSGDTLATGAALFGGHGTTRTYVKQKLVPYGEFVPVQWLFSRFVKLPRGGFAHGRASAVWRLPGLTVSPLVCFEIGFGRLARQAVTSGSDVIIVPLNDSWFAAEQGTSLQNAVASARARSLGVDVVVAAVRGPSAVFHADGSVQFAHGPALALPVRLDLHRPHPTVYSELGDAPLAAVAATLALIAGLTSLCRRHR